MEKRVLGCLLGLALGVCWLTTAGYAQQKLDTANYITSDNAPNQPNNSTADTPNYKEVGPWFTGATGIAWGIDYRQTSQLGGESIAGRSATWITGISPSKAGNCLLYAYIVQSPNNASNVYYTVRREFETLVLDSLRHDQRRSTVNPLTATGNGAWVPLTILPLTPGNVFTTVGADSASGTTIMRADAIRWLRSAATGADLEYGRRHKTGFDTLRIGENWLDSPLGSVTYKEMPLYNLGAQDLIVSSVGAAVNPTRWNIAPQGGTFPMTIHPGQKGIVAVGFRPFQEESVSDSLVVESNDPLEPRASIPLTGNGINYNFILNASLSNEPHYNAPFNKQGDPRKPTITFTGTWNESGTGYAAFPFPIAGGNTHGVYSFDTAPATAAEHVFQMPDSVNGKPGSSGYYFIEWGVIAFTSNSEPQARVTIIAPFSTDTIKATFNQNDQVGTPPFWKSLTSLPVFLTQGDFVKVLFNRPFTPSGGPVLRADLLRIRKIPTGPALIVSERVDFQNVSIYPDVRAIEDNYRLDIMVNSGGESLLRVDSLRFRIGKYYSLVNPPTTPFELPAINGSQKLTIKFAPDTIQNAISDRLIIYTNDTTKRAFNVVLTGNGVGTNMTVEEIDPTVSYLYPANPVIYPDLANMNKWQRIDDLSASGGSRLIGYLYFLQGDPNRRNLAYVEYFPKIPKLPGHTAEVDTFRVFARVTVGSQNSSPAVRYTIFPQGGAEPMEKIVNQNGQTSSLLFLGATTFLRADAQDQHTPGGDRAIYGYIRIENDTNLVNLYYKDSLENRARRDSFVVRADAIILRESLTGIEHVVEPSIPGEYSLSQNFPNPFNPTTRIRFSLRNESYVDLRVYDILGREVKALLVQMMGPGNYTVPWDGRNSSGASVSTGVYVYRLRANDFVSTKKMLLLK